ncbi:sodium:proton antiporter [Nibricoccus aquaticus]|uniref:Sodium:proton antiporter n=1 Tax=Nibricoccus aquaticus TaxID=2576891 RepID=A0A290QMN7_9BACT|nr:sodium:proton antiporter [Nibricoccus aquaticus]ATC65911.1 sodium:proton antiporter [Nibricoccus aquaticus]
MPAHLAEIPPLLIIPFGLLLLLIAVMPLSPDRVKHWWEHRYAYVAVGLGLLVAAYYVFKIPDGGHTVLHTLHEYISFIALIGSLFVVAGGIHLNVKGSATPLENAVFLFAGAILANFVGTTGASMVLIRPFIRMNKVRVSSYHIVFFIFIVSNVGGALTPIGDPPLFLGYLRGVPFFWLLERAVLPWLFTVGAILAAFFVIDRRCYNKIPRSLQTQAAQPEQWRFDGSINVLFLALIIGAVFLPERWFLREIVMLAAAVASYRLTPRLIHEENKFTFGPIKEVGFLFIGIFMTMMPALGYLELHGAGFGITQPLHYYFATGSLSAVLDNAPTYLNFLKLAQVSTATSGVVDDTPAAMQAFLAAHPSLVIAVSLGAVFFGAMTYIGNGPNFMVKSIAESAGVKVPSFFGYILRYSLPVLLPILILTAAIFLR